MLSCIQIAMGLAAQTGDVPSSRQSIITEDYLRLRYDEVADDMSDALAPCGSGCRKAVTG